MLFLGLKSGFRGSPQKLWPLRKPELKNGLAPDQIKVRPKKLIYLHTTYTLVSFYKMQLPKPMYVVSS